MKQIILYGVPGTGKSSIARLCAAKLEIPFYEFDLLRSKLPLEAKDPYLRMPSTLAWQLIGPLGKETAVKGFMRVRRALRPIVTRKLSDLTSDFVAEAAFVDPSIDQRGVALIILSSKEQHYSQFFVHRTSSPEADQQFKAARFIQDSLIDEAERLRIPIIDNISTAELAVADLLRQLNFDMQ